MARIPNFPLELLVAGTRGARNEGGERLVSESRHGGSLEQSAAAAAAAPLPKPLDDRSNAMAASTSSSHQVTIPSRYEPYRSDPVYSGSVPTGSYLARQAILDSANRAENGASPRSTTATRRRSPTPPAPVDEDKETPRVILNTATSPPPPPPLEDSPDRFAPGRVGSAAVSGKASSLTEENFFEVMPDGTQIDLPPSHRHHRMVHTSGNSVPIPIGGAGGLYGPGGDGAHLVSISVPGTQGPSDWSLRRRFVSSSVPVPSALDPSGAMESATMPANRFPNSGTSLNGSAGRYYSARSLSDDMPEVEVRKQVANQLFGMKPWKSKVYTRPLQERSKEVQSLYKGAVDDPTQGTTSSLSFVNICWALFFGWWLAFVWVAMSIAVACTLVGIKYAGVGFKIARYVLWPFNAYMELQDPFRASVPASPSSSSQPLMDYYEGEGWGVPILDARASQQAHRNKFDDNNSCLSASSDLFGRIAWSIIVLPVMFLVQGIVVLITWCGVVTIPMAKAMWEVLIQATLHPAELYVGKMVVIQPPSGVEEHEVGMWDQDPSAFYMIGTHPVYDARMAAKKGKKGKKGKKRPKPLNRAHFGPPHGRQTVVCVGSAANRYYYKYTVGGVNVILLNFIPAIILTLACGYVFPEGWPLTSPGYLFMFGSMSIVPLSYFIGMAITSVSAQSNYAVGALINTTFGSIIEVILYISAILHGLDQMVQAAVTGSLLGCLLLLPGLSMVAGGLKHKEQRFNKTVAGVSSVLLFVSIVGTLSPAIFYHLYASSSMSCDDCVTDAVDGSIVCGSCSYDEMDVINDPVYLEKAKPISLISASFLPIAYIVGLVFTLKTHTHIFDEGVDESSSAAGGHGGHGDAVWSRPVAYTVLVICTILFALIAEELVEAIQPTMEALGLSPRFVGLTLLAVIPTAAEYVNAVQFAMQNNIALAVEIGNAGAVQIALVQVPALVLFSELYTMWTGGSGKHITTMSEFHMIFPSMYIFAMILAVLIVNYMRSDGRANYFEGVSLIIVWLILIVCNYFV